MEKLQSYWEGFRKWFDNVWDFHKWKIIVGGLLIVMLGSQLLQVITTPHYDYRVGWVIGGDMSRYSALEEKMADLIKPYCEDLTGNGKVELDFYYADMMLELKNSAYSDAGKTILSSDFTVGLCPFYIVTEEATAVAKELGEMFYQEAYKFTFEGETMYVMVCRPNGDKFKNYQEHLDLVKRLTENMESVILKPSAIV